MMTCFQHEPHPDCSSSCHVKDSLSSFKYPPLTQALIDYNGIGEDAYVCDRYLDHDATYNQLQAQGDHSVLGEECPTLVSQVSDKTRT